MYIYIRVLCNMPMAADGLIPAYSVALSPSKPTRWLRALDKEDFIFCENTVETVKTVETVETDETVETVEINRKV